MGTIAILTIILLILWTIFLRFSLVTEKEVIKSHLIFDSIMSERGTKTHHLYYNIKYKPHWEIKNNFNWFIQHPIAYIKLMSFFLIASNKKEGFVYYKKHIISERYWEIIKSKDPIIEFIEECLVLLGENKFTYVCTRLNFTHINLTLIEKYYIRTLIGVHTDKFSVNTIYFSPEGRMKALELTLKELKSLD